VQRGLTWLAKPYDMETLAQTVQRVLRAAGPVICEQQVSPALTTDDASR
jgi:hypothetical protein